MNGLLFINWRGIRAILRGMELSKKPNKTAYEVEVVKSYKATMRTTLLSVLLMVIALFVLVSWAFSSAEFSGSNKRYGTVMENGSVRYIQNTEQFMTLEQLGIDPELVSEGDEILMFFDRDDSFDKAFPYNAAKQDTGTKLTVLLASMAFFVVAFIVEGMVLKRTAGRKFSEWVSCDDDIKASLGHL